MSLLSLSHYNRWQAGAAHLLVSAIVGIAVMATMILVWYPRPYFEAAGGNALVLLMVGIDIALGPLLTLAVYNPGKGLGRLRFDLVAIAIFQLIALSYGIHVMFQARPAYLVFAVDRFDLVMANMLADAELAKAPPPWNSRPRGRPPTVGARVPSDPTLKEESLFLALSGIDLPQQPRFFVPFEEVAGEAAKKARPLAELRRLNPGSTEIDDVVRRSGRDEAALAFLPARAPNRDFAVIVDAATGNIVDKRLLAPWK